LQTERGETRRWQQPINFGDLGIGHQVLPLRSTGAG
jgi:hypothetical protein